MKTWLPFVLLAMGLSAAAVADHGREDGPEIDIHEVVRIARSHALEEGRKHEDSGERMEWEILSAERFRTPKFFSCLRTAAMFCSYDPEKENIIREKLDGRIYWLVHLVPAEFMLGGSLVLYIDAHTSELLQTYEI